MEDSTIAAGGKVAEMEAEDFRAAKHVAVVGLEVCAGASAKSALSIGVKRVGELDQTLWAQVWSKVFPIEDPAEEVAAGHKRAEMTTIWEDYLAEKQTWSGVVAALKHREGQSLELPFLGEEIHAAVVASMKEVDELIGDGQCFPQLKAWNYKQDREATLAEVMQYLLVVLEELDESIEVLYQKIQEQNEEITRLRPPDAEPIQVKTQFFHVQEDEKMWQHREEREPEPQIMWLAPVRFTEQEASEFLRKRAEKKANLAGVAAEMQQAREAAFQALIKHGSRSAIGLRELGYLGLETEDEVAEEYSDILVRFQKVEFPHRMKPPQGTPRFQLPEGYAEELQGMGGVKRYPSSESAARDMNQYMTAENPCPICKLSEAENLMSMVYYCRDCLGPQTWNFKHNRKAGVAETMTYFIGAILYRQRQVDFMDMASHIQMGGLKVK